MTGLLLTCTGRQQTAETHTLIFLSSQRASLRQPSGAGTFLADTLFVGVSTGCEDTVTGCIVTGHIYGDVLVSGIDSRLINPVSTDTNVIDNVALVDSHTPDIRLTDPVTEDKHRLI